MGYVRQANIARGHQQVNNGVAEPRAEENKSEQNKLLEVNDGEWLDTGEAGSTVGVDPAVETVGKSDGTEDE